MNDLDKQYRDALEEFPLEIGGTAPNSASKVVYLEMFLTSADLWVVAAHHNRFMQTGLIQIWNGYDGPGANPHWERPSGYQTSVADTIRAAIKVADQIRKDEDYAEGP